MSPWQSWIQLIAPVAGLALNPPSRLPPAPKTKPVPKMLVPSVLRLVIPEFAPGDALMFDERCLHRTHLKLTMTRSRYALECWMFAPSHHTPNYTPLLI